MTKLLLRLYHAFRNNVNNFCLLSITWILIYIWWFSLWHFPQWFYAWHLWRGWPLCLLSQTLEKLWLVFLFDFPDNGGTFNIFKNFKIFLNFSSFLLTFSFSGSPYWNLLYWFSFWKVSWMSPHVMEDSAHFKYIWYLFLYMKCV